MKSCTLTSKERLVRTLTHQQPDRVCVDFGSTAVTGIAASTLAKLRKALLNSDAPIKVHEPYQMLGLLEDDLLEALGVDVMGVIPRCNMFGFENKDWKPFTMFDGTKVLVPGHFNLTVAPSGGWYIYPQGDTSVPPSGHMPKDGFYFDSINRQGPIDEDKLNPADNIEEFGPLSETDLAHFQNLAQAAIQRHKGAVVTVPGTAFGDIALVPAPWLKHPKGIRGVEEWYISTAARRDYVFKVFEKQCENALANLKRLIPVLGDSVQVAFTTGTDFGHQHGLFASPHTYRDLFKPFHKAVNDFIHKNTSWKVFIHSCGSIIKLLPDLIEAGFDILNPVQCSADGMDARTLKKEFGKQLVFWGGGVDTQKTLPFGTPDEVYREVRQRIEIFNQDGGFVFDAIHNVQAGTPIDNVLAMLKAVKDSHA